MGICYIEKSQDKLNFFKKLLKISDIIRLQNQTIIRLPINNDSRINENYQKKLANKITKRLYDVANQNIVLASDLEYGPFRDTLVTNGYNVLDGRKLFKYLLPQVIDYVCQKKKIEANNIEVAIMLNDNSEVNLKMIIIIAQKVKMLRVVTKDIDKFKSVEEYLFKNMGIVIRTTNNKKKALIKSDLIINIDFAEELINKYVLPQNAIIINLINKIKIKSKRFAGTNCNNYSIILPDEYKEWFVKNKLFENFNQNLLLESKIYLKNSFEAIEEALKNVKISCLIGNNGVIQEGDFGGRRLAFGIWRLVFGY